MASPTSNVYLPARLCSVFAESFFFSPHRPAKLRFSYCNFSSSCSSQPPQLNFLLLFPAGLRYHPSSTSSHPPRYLYSRDSPLSSPPSPLPPSFPFPHFHMLSLFQFSLLFKSSLLPTSSPPQTLPYFYLSLSPPLPPPLNFPLPPPFHMQVFSSPYSSALLFIHLLHLLLLKP